MMLEQALKNIIDRYAPSEQLHQMLSYCVMDGGKRIRPTLCFMTMEMLCGDATKALPFACALELIHSYSLVHDDLPSMDNDDMRRGKPSCHKQFGEAMAVLTGDALLTMAAQVLCEVEGEQLAKQEIFNAAMTMVEGQRIDLTIGGTSDELYRKKTGALMLAGILSAARLANCSKEQYDKLCIFGDRLGLLFQLTDDVLDSEQNAEEAQQRIAELCSEGLLALECFGTRAEPLKRLLISICGRKE